MKLKEMLKLIMRLCILNKFRLLILLLFIVNFLLIRNRLHSKRVREYDHIIMKQVLLDIRNQVQNQRKLDKSGMYNLIPNFLTAETRSQKNNENLTIATQCSSNYLYKLVELTERWKRPVSVAVFTYDTDIEFTVKTLAYYHVCNKRIHRSVTFHVVFPIKRTPLTDDRQIEPFNCSSPPVRLSNNKNYEIPGMEYPNNLLRNQAIINSRTTHVLTIDIDFVPSENINNVFRHIQQTFPFPRNSKFAYVVPVFELKDGHKMPSDKQELIKMWDNNLIRPFDIKTCSKCQNCTDYDRWRKLTPGENSYYNVKRCGAWEPFFIVAKSAPLYDERFKQYSFNRISQVCEMHVAGYNFTVVSDAFLIHRRFREVGDYHENRYKENHKNEELFGKLKKELKTKYKDSSRRC